MTVNFGSRKPPNRPHVRSLLLLRKVHHSSSGRYLLHNSKKMPAKNFQHSSNATKDFLQRNWKSVFWFFSSFRFHALAHGPLVRWRYTPLEMEILPRHHYGFFPFLVEFVTPVFCSALLWKSDIWTPVLLMTPYMPRISSAGDEQAFLQLTFSLL